MSLEGKILYFPGQAPAVEAHFKNGSQGAEIDVPLKSFVNSGITRGGLAGGRKVKIEGYKDPVTNEYRLRIVLEQRRPLLDVLNSAWVTTARMVGKLFNVDTRRVFTKIIH